MSSDYRNAGLGSWYILIGGRWIHVYAYCLGDARAKARKAANA